MTLAEWFVFRILSSIITHLVAVLKFTRTVLLYLYHAHRPNGRRTKSRPWPRQKRPPMQRGDPRDTACPAMDISRTVPSNKIASYHRCPRIPATQPFLVQCCIDSFIREEFTADDSSLQFSLYQYLRRPRHFSVIYSKQVSLGLFGAGANSIITHPLFLIHQALFP